MLACSGMLDIALWIVPRLGYSAPAPDRKFTRMNYSILGIRMHFYPRN